MMKQYNKPDKIIIVTPGSIVLNIFLILVVVSHSYGTLVGLLSHADQTHKEAPCFDIESQFNGITRRIESGEDELQGAFIPEGCFLSNVFYGYSLVNISLSRPTDSSFRKIALKKLEHLLTKVEPYQNRVPFKYTDNSLPGGVIYQGNINRLRAGYIILGGSNSKIINDFHSGSKLLFLAFSEANPPFPESFGGLTWPVDGVCALDSLRLHDELFKTTYSQACDKWLAWMKSHLDPQTSLMIAQAGKDSDTIVDGTRGCAMSWSLALLPTIDKEFSRQQYQRFREQWFQPFGPGLLGINEWYQGKQRPTDFQAGPVFAGLGAAATGLGIAAAKTNADSESFHGILRSLELFGVPQYNLQGEKNYFFGLSLLSDTIALWGKTIVPWHPEKFSPEQSVFTSNKKHSSPDSFPLLITVVFVFSVFVTFTLVRRIVRFCKSDKFTRPKRTRLITGIAVFQTLLVTLWLLCPFISWIQVFICMAVTSFMEELIIRPKIVADKFK